MAGYSNGHINKIADNKKFTLRHYYKGVNEFGIPFIDDAKILTCSLVSALGWYEAYMNTYPQSADNYHYGIYQGREIDRQELVEIIKAEIPKFRGRTDAEIIRGVHE